MGLFGGPSKKERIAALEETINKMTGQLGHLGQQIQHLQGTVNQAAQSQATSAPAEESDDLESHIKLLKRAAGVAYGRLSCHRDTWAFIVAKAADAEHFRLPGITKERDRYLVDVDVSGRALIAILETLRKTANPSAGGSEGTRSLASQAYRRIAKSLKQAAPSESAQGRKPEKQPVVRIIIDDRPAAAA